MGIVNRQNIVAVKPGSSVYPGGQEIYGKSTAGKPKLLVQEGQFVAIDPRTQKSVDSTSVADLDKVIFAVGWGKGKYGTAKSLRGTALDGVNKCSLKRATAEPFKCGANAVQDIEFDCIKPDKAYTFRIGVYDYLSESFFPEYHGHRRWYTVTTDECKCEADCNPKADCQELVKDFVDQINGISQFSDDPGLGQWFEVDSNVDLPFYAKVRYQYSKQYCLTPTSTGCTNCQSLPLPTSITTTEGTTSFTGLEDSDNEGTMNRDQLANLEEQINAALIDGEGNEIGWATVSGSTGECCPVQIEINSSDENVTLNGSNITACGTQDYSTTGCAIRIIGKPITLDCYCDSGLPNVPIVNKIRELDIDVVGDGWTCGDHQITEVQKPKPPLNIGYDWAQIDYKSENGGEGRQHDPFNTFRGRLKAFDPVSRAANIAPYFKCDAGYCSITLESVPRFEGNFQAHDVGVPVRDIILIEQGDTTNISDIQDIVNAFIASPQCTVFKAVECIDGSDAIIDPALSISGYGGADSTHGFDSQAE